MASNILPDLPLEATPFRREPHVYRLQSMHTWMCPSLREGFVWRLCRYGIPAAYGSTIDIMVPLLLPIEDWINEGWALDLEEERRILTSGLITWMSGWDRLDYWP